MTPARTPLIASELLVAALGVIFGVLFTLWLESLTRAPDLHAAALPMSKALLEEEGPQWPPEPTDSSALDGAPLGKPSRPSTGIAVDGAVIDGSTGAGTVEAVDKEELPPLPELPPDEEDFRVRAGELEGLLYLEHIFGTPEDNEPLPMIVVLHGRADRARVLHGVFRTFSHPVRVIVPQAPDRLGRGYQWLPVRVGQGLVDRLSSTLFRTATQLARFLREAQKRFPTRGRPIVSGFSQGGILTLTLAIYHDDVVGLAVPLASWLPPPLEPAHHRDDLVYPQILSMHGTLDQLVPVRETEALFQRLRAEDFDARLVTFERVAHTMTDEMNALFRLWLERAVCERYADPVCFAAADEAARIMLGDPLLDAGIGDAAAEAGWDAGADASLEAPGTRRVAPVSARPRPPVATATE